jgi:hypothetical protein
VSGLRAAVRVAGAGSGVGWTRLCDYTQPVAGELARREPAVAGVPVILAWSGTLTVQGSRFDAGFVAGGLTVTPTPSPLGTRTAYRWI